MNEITTVCVGETIIEATMRDGMPYANLRRLCDDLGLDYSWQLQKLKSQHWATVGVIPTVGKDGKSRDMAFISADSISIWLATIQASRVSPDLQPALRAIQLEAKDVLYRHFVTTSQTDLITEVQSMRLSVTELQNQFVTICETVAAIQQDQTAINQRLLDQNEQMIRMVSRIDERTSGKREHFATDIKRQYLSCVLNRYQGACPCCQETLIAENGRRVPDVSEIDHYYHRTMNSIEHGWLVCKRCNRKLKNRKPDGFWFRALPAFQQFQRLLSPNDQMLMEFLK